MTPLAVGIAAAVIAGGLGLLGVAACTRPERRPPALDQGPRGGYRGWFEARTMHLLRPDIVYGVIVTNHRLLLANTGTTSGPADTRREHFGRELATATSPDVLVARRPQGAAFPLADIRRATLREVSWWSRARRDRGAPPGPAFLFVIERSGHPPLKLMIDDATQLSACAAALAPPLGAAFDVPPAVAKEIRAPQTARAVAILRAKARMAVAVIAMAVPPLAVTAGVAAFESWNPPRAVTARVIRCFEHYRARSAPSMVLKLDAPPGEVECSREPFDVTSRLRDLCERRATVHAVYRTTPSGRLFINSIREEGGSDILPAWVAKEREERRRRNLAGVIGACVAVAASGLAALARIRLRLRALGA